MTHTFTMRSVSAIFAAVVLGMAAPTAGARPIDAVHTSSFTAVSPMPTLAAAPPPASKTTRGGMSDWELVAGAGAASLVLVGVGGTFLAARGHRQRRATSRPTVAA